jgi:serine/threonine protein kinase
MAQNIYSIVLVRVLFFNSNLNVGEPFDHTVRMEFLQIQKKLGEGGFGSVYLAYDKLLNQEVAVKILNFSSNFKNS